MELWKYEGKEIKVVCKSGRIFNGKCIDYTQALDNEPEIDSIGLNVNGISYEIYENEIKSIELI
ncbi:MAG: hypothetical protein SOV85_13695 [Clostridium sp.]|jgi:hypothetical protein|uniref:hypothetical protein n=1 Tax=Clostridium sp. TaxID=1506 RepID=UPI00206354C3|nr:hypothetical protein [Clostridium sp.]MDY2632385.1 hypothetical protein [Clostridium sp.]DAO91558.1 MAG TPA: Gemin6 6 [Caudoviricetes sp.]